MNLSPFAALLKTWSTVLWMKTKLFGLIIYNHPYHGQMVLSPGGSSGSLHRSYTKILTIPWGPQVASHVTSLLPIMSRASPHLPNSFSSFRTQLQKSLREETCLLPNLAHPC